MPQVDINEFTLYSFTDDELLEASTFSDLQIAYIRTMRAQAALEKVNMGAASLEDKAYLAKQEYLRGSMVAFDTLLTSHDMYAAAKIEMERQKAAQQAAVMTDIAANSTSDNNAN